VVNDKCRAYNYVSSPPHEFSSCPQCRSKIASHGGCARGVSTLNDCRAAARTGVRLQRCVDADRGPGLGRGPAVVNWPRGGSRPLSSFFFEALSQPSPPSQARPSPEAQLGRRGVLPRPHRPAPARRVTLSSRLSLVSGSRPPTPRRARRSRQPLSSSALHRLVCPPNWLWVPLCHQAVLGVHVASRGEPGDEKGPRERARRAAGV